MYRSRSAAFEVVWLDQFLILPPILDAQDFPVKSLVKIVCNFVACQKESQSFILRWQEFYGKSITEAHVSTIFENCPSLEIFVCRDKFVRDVITNRIRQCSVIESSQELCQRYLNSDEEREYQFGVTPFILF